MGKWKAINVNYCVIRDHAPHVKFKRPFHAFAGNIRKKSTAAIRNFQRRVRLKTRRD